jgi:F-type H+-transporting ATPase subunit epsilon
MNLTIKTPEKAIFEGTVDNVSIPGTQGPFQILKGHAPIVTLINNGGTITYQEKDGQIHNLKATQGIAEAHHNKITILLHA